MMSACWRIPSGARLSDIFARNDSLLGICFLVHSLTSASHSSEYCRFARFVTILCAAATAAAFLSALIGLGCANTALGCEATAALTGAAIVMTACRPLQRL